VCGAIFSGGQREENSQRGWWRCTESADDCREQGRQARDGGPCSLECPHLRAILCHGHSGTRGSVQGLYEPALLGAWGPWGLEGSSGPRRLASAPGWSAPLGDHGAQGAGVRARLKRRAGELGQAGSPPAWKAGGRHASKSAKCVPAWPFQSRGAGDSGEPTFLPSPPPEIKKKKFPKSLFVVMEGHLSIKAICKNSDCFYRRVTLWK